MRKFSWILIALLAIGFANGFASAALAGPHGTQVAGGDNDNQGGGDDNDNSGGDNDHQGGNNDDQ